MNFLLSNLQYGPIQLTLYSCISEGFWQASGWRFSFRLGIPKLPSMDRLLGLRRAGESAGCL